LSNLHCDLLKRQLLARQDQLTEICEDIIREKQQLELEIKELRQQFGDFLLLGQRGARVKSGTLQSISAAKRYLLSISKAQQCPSHEEGKFLHMLSEQKVGNMEPQLNLSCFSQQDFSQLLYPYSELRSPRANSRKQSFKSDERSARDGNLLL